MRRTMLPILALGLATAPPASAHPHLFVEVTVAIIIDDSDAVTVRLDWAYDDFFSLVLTSDLGIDLDGDMQLTADERSILNAAVADWPADFGGDLEVAQGDILPLAPRQNHQVLYENGLVVERHDRPLAARPDLTQPVTIKVYDPYYYVAYALTGPVQIIGRDDCAVTITPADLDAAYSLVDELLYATPTPETGFDDYFPEVGAEFADTITLQCAS